MRNVLVVSVLSIIALGFTHPVQAQDNNDREFKPFPKIATGDEVITPPEGVHPFYKKYINANGILIVGSENVADESLRAARKTVLKLTSTRPDIHKAIVEGNARISIMAFSETASDLPEFGSGADGEWGLGQMPGDPSSLVSEKGIRYEGNEEYIADFLMHEFVHVVHTFGMPKTDPEVIDEIYAAYLDAVDKGVYLPPQEEQPENPDAFDEWRDDEYFTHSVNAYYDLNESLPGPWVDVQIGQWGQRSGTQKQLRGKDPVMVEIIERFFPKSLKD